jgi:hypothetical protein
MAQSRWARLLMALVASLVILAMVWATVRLP